MSDTKPPRKVGYKMPPEPNTHVPTPEMQEKVAQMAAFGITREKIAVIIGMHIDTLAKYYKYELDTGLEQSINQVAGNLFKHAMGDDAKAVSAAQFYLKTRGRWRETNHHEITGADGGPLAVQTVSLDASKLTDEQREALRATLMAVKDSANDQSK